MKKRIIIILSVILVFLLAAAGFLLVRHSLQKENLRLYNDIVAKMKEGGKIHLLMPDLEHLLALPFLQEELRNNANILAAYICYRKDEYKEADHYFSRVKFEGKVFDTRDYVYYWWGKSLWLNYKKTGDIQVLERAGQYFKNVIDNPQSPMKLTALGDYVKSCYYSGDYSFFDMIPGDFLGGKTGFTPSELPEMLYILADANNRKGNKEKTVEYLVRLWKTYPYTDWAVKAEKMLEDLGSLTLIRFPALSVEELLDIYDLSCENNTQRSNLKDLLDKLGKIKDQASGRTKDRVNLLYGKLYYRMKERNKSERYLSTANRSIDPAVKAQAAYYLVRMAGDRYQYSRLKQLAAAVDNPRYHRTKYYEKTAYAAGFPFMRKRKYQDAIPIYKEVLKKETPGNEYYEDALWRLHWCYYHTRQYEKALEILRKLNTLEKWKEYAAYWTAYICQKQNQTQAAENIYRDLLNNSGYTYYGILAGAALEKDFGVKIDIDAGKEKFKELGVGVIDDETRNLRYQTLKESGLYEFAARELEAYLKEKNISLASNPEHWKPYGGELAKLYFYSARYLKAGVNLAYTYEEYISKGARSIPQWFWRICYPLFYKDTIDKYAQAFGADREFLYSFIRQESFFEPYVVSPAGAIGVMQIMPGTGKLIFKEIASTLGLKEYNVDLLYNPEVNIPMGIYHLRYQLYDPLDRYIKRNKISAADNEPMKTILMIAGYNAGIGRPVRWVKEIPFGNKEEFIDQIDIRETRIYVKLVQKHRFLYKQYITK